MELDQHWLSYVHDAFALANAVGPAFAHGKPHLSSPGEAAAVAVPRLPVLTDADARTLDDTGRELWQILRDVAADNAAAAADPVGGGAAAAERLNVLMGRVDARPRMVRNGAAGHWHLHFRSAAGGEGMRWSANLAVAAGMLLGSGDFVRVKGCQAARCERVFLDGTRNRSQQFCSTRCQDRVKASAHRERRRAETGAAS
ncbi:CGNR zinc finger domain-containing protein [Winogradskya consettensis]|uniref:CGNR zinc finger domain-containing protein n=1 Tax=Winogradskya consettensis TaxID=113560 RepID=UPI001BB3D457|nr:CGNR zinc finger domain-containing protein [Actinoplanes consettensis]